MSTTSPKISGIRKAALILAALTPLSAVAADRFAARTGAWEMTTSSATQGSPVPAAALAKMPPAQRARLEATMNARAGKVTSHTNKTCITQQDIDKSEIVKDEADAHCTRKVISRTATSLVIEQSCPAPEAHSARMNMQFPTPTSMSGTIDMTRDDGFKVHITLNGRWLGPSCAGIDD
jgi:hypothetical protein